MLETGQKIAFALLLLRNVELGDLLGEREPAASQAGESELGCTEGRGRVVAAHTSRFGNPFAFFQADELGP